MNNFEFIKTKFNQQNRNFKRKDREYTNKSFFPKQIYQSKSRRNPIRRAKFLELITSDFLLSKENTNKKFIFE